MKSRIGKLSLLLAFGILLLAGCGRRNRYELSTSFEGWVVIVRPSSGLSGSEDLQIDETGLALSDYRGGGRIRVYVGDKRIKGIAPPNVEKGLLKAFRYEVLGSLACEIYWRKTGFV